MTFHTDRIPPAAGRRPPPEKRPGPPRITRWVSAALPGTPWVAGCLLLVVACQQQMADQPRYEPLQRSTFFGDEQSARPLPPGTVARGQLNADQAFYTGMSGGRPVDAFPFPITPEVLVRGRERFDIFCAPCHGRTGNGDGMVVRRGFRPPPSYHTDRLRQAPVGHFFEVMTKGFGAMPDYAAQVPPWDRWAIVAYIRALQLSQHATLADVPPAQRKPLTEGGK